METLEVEILPCGTKAITVNALGPFVKETGHSDDCHCDKCESIFNSWAKAEAERKTYEIENLIMLTSYPAKPYYKPGTIHSGIVVNGKIRITT